ncbi:MAG: AbrB/MazE/SpoVT family DNA-binding domain-containing protein, partial [Firmicutes bacterium]|nr:AbrB/MazE/SpoVT family DNA-binding domain-containing protein [Bacillota bacterium]
MKVTGIIRKLDMLGRIVIPREYRKMLKIREADPLEIIAMDNGDILVR